MSDEGFDKTLVRTDPAVGGERSTPDPNGIAAGAHFGRYVILDRLAAGGMGEVYAAWDPNLDRKVALKILRADIRTDLGESQGRSRLVREAQSMAKLSHPNIVTVHDVGRSDDGEVFIAMEFLDGVPLREWLTQQKRSWTEVLGAFVDAGRGLSQAHKAGIIHRDFKPMNVVVTHTGRVCVLDFGIARTADAAVTEPGVAAASPESSQPLELLTLAGAVMGTPGYMSPEQYRGEPVDARTDQFSFCVALYEGLYGLRPIVGTTLRELKAAAESGELPMPPEDNDAPDWLLPILRRGMAAKPSDRFASMDELLQALTSSPTLHRKRRLQKIALAATTVTVCAVVAAVWLFAPSPCPSAAGRWAGVWEPATQQRVQASFAATNTPYSSAAFEEVSRLFGAYRDAWLSEHHEACLATHVRQEQSPELLDRRMACLGQRLNELRALTSLFQRADGQLVANAVHAVSAVPPVSSCNVNAVLATSVAAPDPRSSQQVAALQAELTRINALLDAGRLDAVRDGLKRIVAQVTAVGYAPLSAQLSLTSAKLAEAAGDFPTVTSASHQAAISAQTANDTETLFRAWTLLARIIGSSLLKPEDGRLFGRYAAAALERTARTPELEAELESALGLLEREAGNYARAIEHESRAVTLLTQAFGPRHPRVGRALQSLAWTESWAGDQLSATKHSREALALVRASVGDDHPLTAKVLAELGSIEEELGDFDNAILHQEQALAIREALYGPDHVMVTASLNNITLTYTLVGRLEDAARTGERAVAITRKTLGNNRQTAHTLHSLGDVKLAKGDAATALTLFEESLQIFDASAGETLEKGYVLTSLGEARLILGQPKLALPPLERALKLREGRETLRIHVGKTRSALARALKATGGDPARIRTLVLQAREDIESAGVKGEPDLRVLKAAFAAEY